MDEKEMEAKVEKLSSIRFAIGEVFENNDLNIGEVVSVLMSMLVEVAIESGISSSALIAGVATACVALEKSNEEESNEDKGTVQWLN